MTFDLTKLPAPSAEPRRSTATHHGIELVDNYAWLKAENWPEVMRDPDALPQDIRT